VDQIEPCPRREELALAVGRVVERMKAFHGELVAAFKSGRQVEVQDFSGRLEDLLMEKDTALFEFRQHVEAHGCGHMGPGPSGDQPHSPPA
jgi:hypothetical protein